jgi:hypothetical protein
MINCKCDRKDIMEFGGRSVLNNYYVGSIEKSLCDLYPDSEWQPWRFNAIPRGYWDDGFNKDKFLDYIENRFAISDWNSWEGITGQFLGNFKLLEIALIPRNRVEWRENIIRTICRIHDGNHEVEVPKCQVESKHLES